jgi:tetratricopeptide (TPR) repeat protein
MKKLFALALVLCLMAPALAAQEQEKKEPTPFQVYSKDQTPENFIGAYNAYTAQMKDTANYAATAMLAYLNYYELEKNLDLLKANMGSLKNMQKFQYGNLLLELDRNEDAIAVYNVLNEASPKWSCPWRHKGQAYFKLKNYPEAEKALLMAIETRKEHYDAYIWLAEVYRASGDYEKGLKAIKDGMEQYGKDIEDPEKEYSSAEVAFLHLDLLKKAGKSGTDDYKHVLESAKKLAPEDERLKQY